MSMKVFEELAEQRIQEAMRAGEFDDLPGKGAPLRLDDDAHVPPELRMAYRVLKNAGCLPPEIELRREIAELEDLLDGMQDTREKYLGMKRLNFLVMKLNMAGRKPIELEREQRYEEKLVTRFGRER